MSTKASLGSQSHGVAQEPNDQHTVATTMIRLAPIGTAPSMPVEVISSTKPAKPISTPSVVWLRGRSPVALR